MMMISRNFDMDLKIMFSVWLSFFRRGMGGKMCKASPMNNGRIPDEDQAASTEPKIAGWQTLNVRNTDHVEQMHVGKEIR